MPSSVRFSFMGLLLVPFLILSTPALAQDGSEDSGWESAPAGEANAEDTDSSDTPTDSITDVAAEPADTTGDATSDAQGDDWGDDEDWGDVEVMDEVEEVKDSTIWFSDAYPNFSRASNLYYARPARPLSVEFIVSHRSNIPIKDSPFENYLGLDGGGLKIQIGARFGIVEGLDAGFTRLNNTNENFDTYEWDVRFRMLQEERHFVNMALRAGASWFHQDGADDALGGFGQLIVDKLLFDRLLLGASLMAHSDSSSRSKSTTDDDFSLAAGFMMDLRLAGILAYTFELSHSFAGYGEKTPIMTTGLKFLTNRHVFLIVVSNSQYTGSDGVVSNTNRTIRDTIFGFSILREI